MLRGLARIICELQDAACDPEKGFAAPSGLPTIHGSVVMRPEFVEARFETLDKLDDLLGADGVWSRSSLDDTLWDFIARIADLQPGRRSDGIAKAVEETAGRFNEVPSSWVVDIIVYGFDQGCAGVRFGRILLIAEDIDAIALQHQKFDGFPRGTQVLARLETTAIDERSAREHAESILDEHLLIINALCARDVPSPIQVSRTDHIRPLYSATRIAGDQTAARLYTSAQHRRIPLAGPELREETEGPVGGRVHAMLNGPDNEFNRRVLLGYQYAGAACVDHHPERSFLMLAIALESSILGKDTKTELTYQLGARVAHLIGNGLLGRKLVARTVNDLYDRRSRIVHAGQYGVSRREAILMFFYCKTALTMLVMAPSFRSFTTNTDLEGWFKDRILDGPNHYPSGS